MKSEQSAYRAIIPPPLRWMGIVTAILWMLGNTACKKGFTSDQFEDDHLVVLAEISAGDSVRIPVGKTIRVGNGNLLKFERVNDATVTLKEENTRTWLLQPSYAWQYANNPTSVFTNRKRYKSNTTYSIEISHPTMGTATGTTHIPPLPKWNSIDTVSQVHETRNALAVTVNFQDAADKDDYYIVEGVKELLKPGKYFIYQGVKYDYYTNQGKTLYEQVKNTPGVILRNDTVSINKFLRLELFTEDPATENARFENLHNPFRRLFLTDKSFNGQSYTFKFYVDKQFFIATEPFQKGRVRIQFKAVSKELFDYLLDYEKYKTDFGAIPANQLPSPTGNIKNGLGILGGSARRERIYYFDTLW
ncbi:DUF4249 domain-containing protein [Paraflavitalea sp. CAU 1676]|nr:DUF4249 domain-containing protein [Paraflavitalea sp. CAU 1676]